LTKFDIQITRRMVRCLSILGLVRLPIENRDGDFGSVRMDLFDCWTDLSRVYHGCGDMDHGGEALIGFVGAERDAFELLERGRG
jgi:hypothetical protein